MKAPSYLGKKVIRGIKGSLPKIVPFTEHEICLIVEFGSDFTQPAVAAATLEAVLVPEALHSFQQEPLCDHLPALGTKPRAIRVARHSTA